MALSGIFFVVPAALSFGRFPSDRFFMVAGVKGARSDRGVCESPWRPSQVERQSQAETVLDVPKLGLRNFDP